MGLSALRPESGCGGVESVQPPGKTGMLETELHRMDSTQPSLSGVETPVRIPASQALQSPLSCEHTDMPCRWTGCDSVRRGQPYCIGSSLTGEAG